MPLFWVGWLCAQYFLYISITMSITHASMQHNKTIKELVCFSFVSLRISTNFSKCKSMNKWIISKYYSIILTHSWQPEHRTFSQSSCSISTRILMSSGIARAGWVSFNWIATWERVLKALYYFEGYRLSRTNISCQIKKQQTIEHFKAISPFHGKSQKRCAREPGSQTLKI